MDELLNPKETAGRLGMAVQTLAAWRAKGFGPRYVKVGARVRYSRTAIEEWLLERTRGEMAKPQLPHKAARQVRSPVRGTRDVTRRR